MSNPVDPRLLAKPGKKQTAVHDPDLKRLRAVAMLKERVYGASYEEIAEKFRVHPNTVRNTLTYAKRAGIIVEESDRILEEMIPLSRKAIIEALSAKDDEVDKLSKANLGVKLFEGTGLLGNKGKPSGANGDDDELLRSMNELRQQAQLLAETTEGELLNADGSPQRLLPDATGLEPADPGEAGHALSTSRTEGAAEDRAPDGPPAAPPPPAEDGEPDDEGRLPEA